MNITNSDIIVQVITVDFFNNVPSNINGTSRHCDVLKNSAGKHSAYYAKKNRCCEVEERII